MPVELDEIILRAMEKEPDDRFDSAVEMRDALADFLQLHLEGGPTCRSGDFPTMDVRAARARSAGQRRERGRAKRQRDPETARRRARIRNIVIVSAVVLVLLGGLGAGGWALWKFLDVPEVQVPPIVGVHITQAEEMLARRQAAAGHRLGAAQRPGAALHHRGPARARSWVKEGAVIELVSPRGPRPWSCPTWWAWTSTRPGPS
ncbi:MAG: hypothetical protein A6D92_10190 [Symbiobacterium thermophilum]|uniref:PASTA domain-containing protein n=1 Tax=Symbiobacterium thermophilum TaxID=2734 RepID=A0A1Y2T446_SYMTR|nr:MAG: hypothetical protein A6D92_10190 [Symbiobacterium thermophilum]